MTRPERRWPPVTVALILVNLLCYLGTAWLSGSVTPTIDLLALGGKLNEAVLSGQWWRLVTSCYLHAGLLHLGLNMYVLWSVGNLVEPWLGAGRTFVAYTLAGLCGGLASTWFGPELSVGASGAVLGLIGAGWMMSLLDHRLPEPVRAAMGRPLLSWLVLNLLLGALIPLVDNTAHLGGVAGGLLASAALHPAPLRRLAGGLAVLLVPVVGYAGGWGGRAMTLHPSPRASEAIGLRLPVPTGWLQRDGVRAATWFVPGLGVALSAGPVTVALPEPGAEADWLRREAGPLRVLDGPSRLRADGHEVWWMRLAAEQVVDCYFWFEATRGYQVLGYAERDAIERYAPAFRRAALGLSPWE